MSDEQSGPPPGTPFINIDLAGIAALAARVVAITNRRVALCLQQSPKDFDEKDLPIPGAELEIRLQVPGLIDTDETWTSWVLGNGFRDLAHLVTMTLEEVFVVLAIWDFLPRGQATGMFQTTIEHYQSNVVARVQSFHDACFPDKVKKLERAGFIVPARTLEQYRSVIDARNCLVHRNGIVGEKDLNGKPTFRLDWRAAILVLERDGKFEELKPNVPVENGGNVMLRIIDQKHEYTLGQNLNISTKQFSQIGWCLWIFAQEMADLLMKIAAQRGIALLPAQDVNPNRMEITIAGPVHDLQHRFETEGRAYVVEVCGCGDHPVAEPVTTFDSIIYTCVPDQLLDHEDDDPEILVRQVFDHVHPLLPNSIDVDQWTDFVEKVLAWVCAHRAAAALRTHND